MDPTGSSGNITQPMPYFNDFGLQDFLDDELNFDQVIEMLRGEAPIPNTNNVALDRPTLDHDHHDHDNHPHTLTRNILGDDLIDPFWSIAQEVNVFNNFNNSPTMSCTTSNMMLNSLSGIEDDMMIRKGGDEDEDEEDEDEDTYGEAEHSSATTTTTITTTTTAAPFKSKGDRSRTLISERRRRGRMKEKLYALRALVPNITKMDKASIVGDAVLYVQDLQMQSKKLKSQIGDLQLSLKAAERCKGGTTPRNNAPPDNFLPLSKMIMQMDVLQIEEKEFHVKVVSNKGQGVAASLYKSLESFTNFIIQNSNLNTVCERFVLTFTLNVGKCREDMTLPNLKLWVTGAFLNQGFEFQAF